MADVGNNMKVRKLAPSEHGRTRTLYETVFFQDEARFVDYYYTCKTRNNVIYVAEDEKGIHAMLHLNPVKVCWNGKTETIYYIVAVATEQEYRHQGLMRRLLNQSMQELYEQRAPYVFLMPASEAIYTPFGFRRAWEWRWEEDVMLGSVSLSKRRGVDLEKEVPGKKEALKPEMELTGLKETGREHFLKAAALGEMASSSRNALQVPDDWRPAAECSEQQLQELSSYVNSVLSEQFQMFVQRSSEYYRNLDCEQKASGGQLEILFPFTARCTAKEKFPNMMTRIIHLESFIRHLKSEEEKTFYWQVKDELLPENNGLFEIKLSAAGGELRRLQKSECETGRKSGEIQKGKEVKEIDISEIPDLLGASNPFLYTMISEVV